MSSHSDDGDHRPEEEVLEQFLKELWSPDETIRDWAWQELLLRMYHGRCLRIAFRILWNADDADEVVSESFMRVFTSRQFDSSKGTFDAWLAGIVKNAAIDRFRSRHPTISLDAHLEGFADFDPRSDEAGPFEVTAARELSERLRWAIAQLPELERTVLIMYVYEERTIADIAKR